MARELGHVLLVCLLQVVLSSTQPLENIAEPKYTSTAKVSLDYAENGTPRIINSSENIYNSHEVELDSHEHYPYAVGQHAFAIPQQRSIEIEIDYDDSTGKWNTGSNENSYNEPNERLAPEQVSDNNFSPLIVKWLPLYINVQDLPNSINVHINKKKSENNQPKLDKNPNRWFNVPDRYGNIMSNAPLPPESANPRMRFQSPPVLRAGDYSGRFITDPQGSKNNMSDTLDVQDASERIHMSDVPETHNKLNKSDASERSSTFDDYNKTDIPDTTDRSVISNIPKISDIYEAIKNTNIPLADVSERSDISKNSIVSDNHYTTERSDILYTNDKAHIPEVSSRSDVSDAVERSGMAIPTSATSMPETTERSDMSESHNKTDNSAAFNRTNVTYASERSGIPNIPHVSDLTDASNMSDVFNNDSSSTEMQNVSENLDVIDGSNTTDVVDKSDFSDMYDPSEEVSKEQRYLLMQFLKYWRDKIMFARFGQAAGMQYNPRTSEVAPRSSFNENSAQADYSPREYRMAPNNHDACKDHMEDGQ